MPRAGRQTLGGLVVNERPKVARHQVDLLRAILHNCHRHGPSTQNRDDVPAFEEHLRGRIAWVAQHDPVRGAPAAGRPRRDRLEPMTVAVGASA